MYTSRRVTDLPTTFPSRWNTVHTSPKMLHWQLPVEGNCLTLRLTHYHLPTCTLHQVSAADPRPHDDQYLGLLRTTTCHSFSRSSVSVTFYGGRGSFWATCGVLAACLPPQQSRRGRPPNLVASHTYQLSSEPFSPPLQRCSSLQQLFASPRNGLGGVRRWTCSMYPSS